MKLECVLVACNENSHYLDFWPIVKKAWPAIVGVPVKMIYVSHTFPEALQNDPDVIFFKAIDSWPTATQAQCIRLLYPSLLQCEGAVMLSDMDMIPMQSSFFTQGFSTFDESKFVSLRGIDEHYKNIYMCYAGATPAVWSAVFHIKNEDDIRSTLQRWSSEYPSNGKHGSDGWATDQERLYHSAKTFGNLGLLPCVPIPRVDRIDREIYNFGNIATRVRHGTYVDFHMPAFNAHESLISTIFTACPKVHS